MVNRYEAEAGNRPTPCQSLQIVWEPDRLGMTNDAKAMVVRLSNKLNGLPEGGHTIAYNQVGKLRKMAQVARMRSGARDMATMFRRGVHETGQE